MTSLLVAQATECDNTSWPDAIVYLGLFALMGFAFWMLFKNM